MSWIGWEIFPGGWKTLPDVREWSVGPPGCPGVVGRLSPITGRCREALWDVRE